MQKYVMNENKSWFTITKIDENTYALRELNHSEKTNSFLLIGNEKSLLIDTGMGVENIYEIVNKLTNKPIITVITHAHWDHIGSNDYANKLYIHDNEKEWLNNFPLSLERVKKELLNTNKPFPSKFEIDNYHLPSNKSTDSLTDNQIIDLGNRKIKVVFTPGHSPGHVCFYEENTGYLFSGDIIYKGELDCYYPSTEPEIYRLSIKKLLPLQIKYVFGGHHDLFLSPKIIEEASEAFDYLHENGLLNHHDKIYYFKNISIRL